MSTLNQFSRAPVPSKYTVEMDLAEYKLFKRLRSLDKAVEVHLYCGEDGRVKSLRVFESKKEELLTV
jgi:hypothetical protein